ncbi:MAG: zinc transport system substrate-binding protein [Natronomonas sp.]|jgi:zinc transport system substrate-binding protein|uniref:metal ABC transporter solute-binding protein, Zn/Mn family n=1 Tax=Natronomonas sp. TaxID=2184060 RepID=UPI003989331C
MRLTRRDVLGGVALSTVGGLAGCTGGGDGSENAGAFTAFFTLEDFTRQVVGDAMAVENPVPVGRMGHRYEVGSQAQIDAVRSRAFVFLDIAGFQSWARDTATNLRENHPDITVIDALENVDLRGLGGERDATEEANRDASVDPHYWLDPLRSAESVRTIAEGLSAADPDNADTYDANATAYVERLEALDEQFREELSSRSFDTIVVAGHDSYQYLATRYDFEVHSPVGVSPNAEPGSAEIADTIDLIDNRGIDVVLYDAFASPKLAETIVEESTASETMAISPAEGTKQAWVDDGWGYVEQMKELNLPAFKRALNAE